MNDPDRRLLLAFVLSMTVFLLYQVYISHKYPPRRAPVSSVSRTDTSDAGSAAPVVFERAVEGYLAEPKPAPAGITEETHVLSGNGFEAVTTTVAAGIRQIRLTGIARVPHRDTRDVILISETWAESFGGLRFPAVQSQNFKLMEKSSSHARYVLETTSQLRVDRLISTTDKRYEIRLQTKIKNVSAKDIHYGSDSSQAVGLSLSPFPVKVGKTDLDIQEVFLKLGSDVEHRQEATQGFFDNFMGRKQKASEEKVDVLEGALRWISMGDRYFTLSLIPAAPLARAILTMEGPKISGSVQYGSWTLGAGQEKVFEESIYAGPKDPEQLKRYGKDLLEVMNFGWFEWLGFWMLWVMNQFHRLIANYGVAIILLTVLVRIVLYPLTYTSYVSMAKLKELAPKMKSLQEKHAENRDKLNKEMMKLYKDNKVNPLGGCLPIVLQIPVFIAFYRMLQYSIELRGAEFLWVHDLSQKDPYYVLPVLMGAAMLMQQKMTPTPDPQQAKIGMIMTVVFTFLFLTFPGGLNLYWFVSTVLGIWQQKMIERRMKGKAALAASPEIV